jgi:hypothetical protein
MANVYVVADAWDGAEIKSAIERFFVLAGGGAAEKLSFHRESQKISIAAGGLAHVTAFVGHNGLMDFSLREPQAAKKRETPASSVVLACASKQYFTRINAALHGRSWGYNHAQVLSAEGRAEMRRKVNPDLLAWRRVPAT